MVVGASSYLFGTEIKWQLGVSVALVSVSLWLYNADDHKPAPARPDPPAVPLSSIASDGSGSSGSGSGGPALRKSLDAAAALGPLLAR
jgi:hypothetical protein